MLFPRRAVDGWCAYCLNVRLWYEVNIVVSALVLSRVRSRIIWSDIG